LVGAYASKEWAFLKTALYLISGQNPFGRANEIESVLAAWPHVKRTVLASAEILACASVDQQAKILALDMAWREQGVHVLRLSPGCLCCSSKLVLFTHIGRTLRLSQPDVLVLELDSQSHVAEVKKLLQESQWQTWFSVIHEGGVEQKVE
jgi:hypothetical protein